MSYLLENDGTGLGLSTYLHSLNNSYQCDYEVKFSSKKKKTLKAYTAW